MHRTIRSLPIISRSISSLSIMTTETAAPRAAGGNKFPRRNRQQLSPRQPKAVPAAAAGVQSRSFSSTPVNPATSTTRFSEIPGLNAELLKAIPYEFCTDVRCANVILYALSLTPGPSGDPPRHPGQQRCSRAGQDRNGKDAGVPRAGHTTHARRAVPDSRQNLHLCPLAHS